MTRKPSPIQRVGPASNLPKQIPPVPPEFLNKFKELEPWQEARQEFWYDTISVLQADSTDLRNQLNQALNDIATLKARLDVSGS
jgi:hypothetical protein